MYTWHTWCTSLVTIILTNTTRDAYLRATRRFSRRFSRAPGPPPLPGERPRDSPRLSVSRRSRASRGVAHAGLCLYFRAFSFSFHAATAGSAYSRCTKAERLAGSVTLSEHVSSKARSWHACAARGAACGDAGLRRRHRARPRRRGRGRRGAPCAVCGARCAAAEGGGMHARVRKRGAPGVQGATSLGGVAAHQRDVGDGRAGGAAQPRRRAAAESSLLVVGWVGGKSPSIFGRPEASS